MKHISKLCVYIYIDINIDIDNFLLKFTKII